MENWSQYLPKLLVVLVIIFVVLIIISAVKKAGRRLKYKIRNLFSINTVGRMVGLDKYGVNASDLLNAVNDARTTPEIKSVGGMTSIYLSKIQEDFPNFHNNDAETIIGNFIKDYLEILYGAGKSFSKNVSDRLVVRDKKSGNISDITINGTAIYGYTKANDYATIKYRCSVGYNENSQRIETRYEIDYSYQLATENTNQMGLLCPNCGGKYNSIHDTKCPYCGALVVKDTYMNWVITNIKEI